MISVLDCGQAPKSTDPPERLSPRSWVTWWWATCCAVVGTSAGYVALAHLNEPAQPAAGDPGPAMFYSPDGSSWLAVDPPAGAGARLHRLHAV